MPKALIACFENWDTLQEIPFVIHSGGYTVDVYCSKDSWLLAGSYYHRWIESNNGNRQHYIAELIRLSHDYDWVIPGDETVLLMLNASITDTADFLRVMPIVQPGNRNLIGSKSGLSDFCRNNAIASPAYHVYGETPNWDEAIRAMQYPVLIKPDEGYGGGGIIKCQTADEVFRGLDSIQNKHHLVVQAFITGKDIGVEAFFKNGELVLYDAADIVRYFNTSFSFTTARYCYKDREIENFLREIGQKIGIHGFASIQLIKDNSSGQLLLIEADLRPNFWVPYGRFANADFAEAIKLFNGSRTKPMDLTPGKRVKVALFYRDLIRAFNKKDIKTFAKWLFNYKGFWRFIPTYDKKLFKRLLKELFVKKALKRLGI